MDLDDKKIKELIEKIAEKHSLKLLLLFGSQASGKTRKNSDFDIAYLTEKKMDLMEEANLILELTPVFKSENIDLVNIKNASPLLLFAITKEAKIIFEARPLIYASLAAYAFKKYIESKPIYEEKFKRLEAKLKS